MAAIGVGMFYLGLFGLIFGIVGLFRGNIEILNIRNRKQVLKFIGIAFILVMVGALLVGPNPNQTAEIQPVIIEERLI